MTTIFTSKHGVAITQVMLDAAIDAALEHGIDVSAEQAKTVLDVGLPYSMKSIPAAADAAGLEEWVADVMADSAIAAIE